MTRPIRTTRGRRLTAAAAVLAAALPGLVPTGAAARTNTFDKPVVFVSGPEVPGNCKGTAKIEEAIKQAHPVVKGQILEWKGKFRKIEINPKGGRCVNDGTVVIDGPNLYYAAQRVSKQLETWSEKEPIDVVALGTGGTVLRYAMVMSTRNAMKLWDHSEDLFAKRLDIEDVVTLGSALDGAALVPASCGGGGLCDDLVKPAAPDPKPIHWQLMDSPVANGRNPQGVGGTDWSVIGLDGDRFAPPATATGIDAAHKTVYEDPNLTFEKALWDTSHDDDAKLRFLHAPNTLWTSTTKGPHVAERIAEDVVYGVGNDPKGEGPAFDNGCAGFSDTGGPTVLLNPKFPGYKGDPRSARTIKVGTLDAVSECFRADPNRKDTFLVLGPNKWVRVNGIDFFLKDADAILGIDVKTRRVWRRAGTIDVELPVTANTSLPVWTFAPNNLTDDLDWKFPTNAGGVIQSSDGTVFQAASPKLKIKGWSVSGGITIKTVKGGLQLETSLALPGVFSSKLTGSKAPECSNGVDDDKDGKLDLEDDACMNDKNGDYEDRAQSSAVAVTLGTSNSTGLQLDKFSGSIGGGLKFGAFRSEGSVGVEYSKPDDEIKVTLAASLPAVAAISVKLKVGFKNGSLASIYGELDGLSIPLWQTGWFVQKFGLGVSGLTEGKQREILIAVGISFLRKVAGKYFIYLDGDLTVSWGTPWKFKLNGNLAVLDERYGNGSLEYEQNVGGKLNLTLGREIDLTPKTQFIPQGIINGALSTTGELDIGASIQACFKGDLGFKTYDKPTCIGKADMRLTRFIGQPISQAVCFKTTLSLGGDVSVGFVTTYDYDAQRGFQSDISFIARACDVADYGAKKVQVGGSADGFTIQPGTDRQVVTVRGAEGKSPNVVLVAPDGRRFATPTEALSQQVDPNVHVLTGLGGVTTFVLGGPQAGRWKVETQPGSPAVEKIDQLEVLPEPKVAAKVVRERGGFALAYDVKRETGQRVRFVERAGAVNREVGVVGGGKGRLKFKPAFGPAGKRKIVAIVEQDGRVRREVVVGAYGAPAPAKPGKVKTVTVKRKGGAVSVTWSKALRATGGYEVFVRLPDGRTFADITKRRKVVLSDLVADGKVDVRVRALRKQDEAGGPLKVVKRKV